MNTDGVPTCEDRYGFITPDQLKLKSKRRSPVDAGLL